MSMNNQNTINDQMIINQNVDNRAEIDTFDEELEEMKRDPRIQRLRDFQQHKCSNTYDHVFHVARTSHAIEQKLHLKVDEKSLARGAVLHDYYLYDFREHPMGAYEHGTSHANTALQNAEKDFELNEIERNIIYVICGR